ncbi:hypothetical protein GWI33_004491 [Rhynchophorus ferrugineus]|uniref:Polynucleotide 5'-hydroxyl-kinase NOL9 n=1 Tax=Rhynchophorus ferrugineus TaxID=354439 RepID=A0A834ILH5_RHYFE|nr:hypothetical protein GWI33_004491 [Rhynchophorus ferrugineus]
MKVVNKLDENYLELIRDALNKKTKGVNLKKSENSRKSACNVATQNPHVKLKKEMFKAKERLNRSAKRRIKTEKTTLINSCSDNSMINITTRFSKKNGRKNEKPNSKSDVLPSKNEESVKVVQKDNSKSEILTKTNKSKVSASVNKAKKIYVLNPQKLGDSQCESLDDITQQTRVTSPLNVVNKKIKNTKPKSKRIKQPKSSEQEILKPTINPTNGNDIKTEDKFSKHLKRFKLNYNKSVEQGIAIGKNKKRVDIFDCCDNEEVCVKGLKFNRFCSQFIQVYNEHAITQGGQFNIPKKHFNISLSDIESDTVQNDKLFKDDEIKAVEGQQTVKKIIESGINQNAIYNGKNNSIQDVKTSNHQVETRIQCYANRDNQISDDESSSDFGINIPKSSEDANIESEEKEYNNIIKLKNNNILVLLDPCCLIHFHGLCIVEVINGEIEVLGAILNKSNGSQKIFSPRGSSLLYIKNNLSFSTVTDIHISELDIKELPEEYHNKTYNENTAILLCRELHEFYIGFIESHIPQIIFPVEFTGPRVDFALTGVWNKLETDNKWIDILEDISVHSTVAIVGGKGTGKSTFLRYSVNNLLAKFAQVRVVDLDSGQSEFTIPGVISIITVEDYLLGPNYTHFLNPDCMILCHINIGHDINKYIQSVKYLSEFLSTLSPMPTLINFPGFTLGLGLDICLNAINLFKPTALIEILSQNKIKNYNINLTPANVKEYAKQKTILGSNLIKPMENLWYEYISLNSLADNQSTAWSLESRQSREISILSYFGKLMSDSIKDLSNTAINMYSINLSSVTLKNSEGHTVSPLAINANLVVLGSPLEAESFTYYIYGYGVVRGIDLQNDILILLTPEPLEVLNKVNHIIMGSVTMPPSLLMNVADVKGLIPYVSVGELVEFGQFTKRSYLPPGK